MNISFETISTNKIYLHTAFAGPEDGPPAFLLHGFPDAWFGWEAQIQPLAQVGFRVIVPDQRGYNLSDKPSGVNNYRRELLVDDILGVADSLGYQNFHIAGHDFGAMVSWNLAMSYPERLKSLVIANVPHPAVMRTFLRSHPRQLLKSWYAFFFQLPEIAEWAVKTNNWQFLMSAMPDGLTNAEQDRYRQAWEQPNAINGMINWYRASLRQMDGPIQKTKIQVPTLIVWGKQDPHLSYEMAPLSLEYCEEGQLITFEDATHWVMHDKPEQVSQILTEHFLAEENNTF